MRVIFFWKCSKLNLNLENSKKIQKLFFILRSFHLKMLLWIISSKTRLLLRFWISARETFSAWIAFPGVNKFGKGVVLHLWNVFQPVYHVTCRRVLWNETFLEIYLTMSFRVPKFKNTSAIIHQCHSFFENFQNWIKIYKTQKKIQKMVLVSVITAYENVAIFCLY